MATLKDIAERVGVSTCTVSRYINGKIVVKEETARKIDQAIRDLDYHKNYMAVALKTSSSKMIALIIPTLKNVFFAEIAGNIGAVLEEEGYSMVTFTTENDLDRELATAEKLLALGIAGAIFMTLPLDYKDGDHIKRLQSHNIACLMINRFFEPNRFSTVATDFYQGVCACTQLLLDRGAKKIGLIVGADHHPQSDTYRMAFTEVIEKRGIKLQPDQIQNCHFDNQETEVATEYLLDQGVDGILGVSDFISLISLKIIEKRKMKIPEDILLMGSGNTKFSELVSISSLNSRTDLLGEWGAKMMLRLLRGDKKNKFLLVEPHIVERRSTMRT